MEIVLGFLNLILLLAVWICIWIPFRKPEYIESRIRLCMLGGVFMRGFYGFLMNAHTLQNDIGSFQEQNYGHLGYIYQIYTEGLPQVSPIGRSQFYHPPLHHSLAAGFLKVCNGLGLDMAEAAEYLQVLSLLYGFATLVVVHLIAKELGISAKGRLVIIMVASYFPYGIMMGGAINNDPLATLMMLSAVYFTLRWYHRMSWQDIVCMALAIGLAMMSKLSGAMIAPMMAWVMLRKAWQERAQWKKVLGQFACFGCIAFPLGLWHSVTQWLKYEVPLGFVPSPSLKSGQALMEFTEIQRFFDFQGALEYLPIRWNRFNGFVDHNIFTTMWKSGVFGEGDFLDTSISMKAAATPLFWCVGILLAALLVGSIWYLCADKQESAGKILLTGSAIIIFYMYFLFCLNYPFVCTMNIRYVMVAIYLMMIMLGAAVERLWRYCGEKGGKAQRIYGIATGVFATVYISGSVLMFWNLGMLQLLK